MEVHEIVNRLHRMAVNTGTLNCFGCGYEHNCGTHGCAVMRKAADKLEELNTFEQTNSCRLMRKLSEEREKHRWIPVAERLPEKFENVLITYLIPNEKTVRIWIGYRTETVWWTYGVHNPNVTAWMPLPEPYEPDSVGQKGE